MQADVVLAHALPIEIETGAGSATVRRGRCASVPAGASAPLPLPPGTTRVELAPGPPATIRLRRFALSEYPLVTNGIPSASTTLLRIPRDGVTRPWRLQLKAAQKATVCR